MEIYEKLLNSLKKSLPEEETDDLISSIFEERSFEIHSNIMENSEYKKYIEEIRIIQSDIEKKFENSKAIIKSIENYENVSNNCSFLCEKLMYKYGFYDAICFLVKGLKEIDLNKFFNENQMHN